MTTNTLANHERIGLLPHYVHTRGLARFACAGFVLVAAMSWVAAGYDLGELRTLAQIQDGSSLAPAEILAHKAAGKILSSAQLLCAVLIALAFLPWLFQVRCNLRSFGLRRLRFGREWTYLGFVIPGLNAFRPHQVLSEVARGSSTESIDPVGWQRLPTPPIVTAWWVALVAWVVMEIISGLLLELATGLARIQFAHALALAADVFAATSASLGFFMVTNLQAAQEAKRELLDRGALPDSRTLLDPHAALDTPFGDHASV